MGAFYTRLSTRLAILAIVSAAAIPVHAQSTAPGPPTRQASPSPSTSPSPSQTTSPSPSSSQTTSPSESQGNPPGGRAQPPGVPDPAYAARELANCSIGEPQLPDPLQYGADAGSAIKAISRATEHFIDQCNCATQECIANALDDYAAALAEIAPQMPPELRNLPNIVATAAHRVRVARTRRLAVQALNVAISAVHKTIALLRADDPVTLKTGTREGGFVAETLQVASLRLERTSGL